MRSTACLVKLFLGGGICSAEEEELPRNEVTASRAGAPLN